MRDATAGKKGLVQLRAATPLFFALLTSAQLSLAQSSDPVAPTASVGGTNSSYAIGSNIGLTTYPSLQCPKPQFAAQTSKDGQTSTDNTNVAVHGTPAVGNDETRCTQNYIANANADLRRIRSRLEAAKDGSTAVPSSAAEADSNIGLRDYPANKCIKPSNIDMSLKPSSAPSSNAKNSEIEAYNQRVRRYADALNKYNAQTADHDSCIQIYTEIANADIRRVQSALEAAISIARNANIKTVSMAETSSIDTSTNEPFFDDQHIDTVNVEANKIPPDHVIHDFVKSYASPSMKADKIPKWASGICPVAEGLSAEENLGVAAFVKQVATKVGAPVATNVPCNMNVEVIFTRTPQAVLDDIAKNHEYLLGYHDVAQTKRIATMSHPIQAWYATATRDNNGILSLDGAPPRPECEGARMQLDSDEATYLFNVPAAILIPDLNSIQRYCGGMAVTGNHLNDGLRSEFSYATIVVDVTKLGELELEPVANYVAMLALSQTRSYEVCQPLVSITNLLTSVCDVSFKPNTLSDNDMAYLKALYKMNSDNMLQGQQSDIASSMEKNLGAH